ncbi:hypothetical protein K458DRAFT_481669 [Lentithecium fluviatile CBS 122367]|uniref:Heterokaryon incompatibility domain-containing protein n=1 Tax=Lentithecium fluviatile CBS 122367 TaxID=1168545 RepID=A0A6G1IFF9_9PLEO|nr:hypothetical protein K458DRAFT_481669 [Lentithecium fluviatile CBS 122367]
MLPYQYNLLQHEDSIRILVLHPNSNDSDPLICTIKHVRLSDASLDYEAVSYTWGDAAHLRTIFFHNGRGDQWELRVGTNCHSALRHLRQKKPTTGRSSQVRIMDKIYSSASGVTMCLGEETASSCIVFEELAEADRVLSQGEDCDRPPPSSTIVQGLETLFQRPWFKRVWVLQEVFMSRSSTTFMCGSASASMRALHLCIGGYNDTRVTRNPRPLALDLADHFRPEFRTPQFTLWNLLFESRTCLATDPRDRVFALRSLIGHRQSELDFLINYVKSIEEIFIETAMFLLPVLGLQILTATRHPHEMDMPSWIPNWYENFPLNWVFFSDLFPVEFKPYEPNSKPLDKSRYEVRSFVDRDGSRCLELIAKGCQYSQVDHASQNLSFLGLDDAEAQLRGFYYSLDNLRELLGLEGTREDDTIIAMSLIDGPTLHRYLARGFIIWWQAVGDTYVYINNEHVSMFLESLQQCKIAMMDNGELPIVPRSVCNGDRVCVLSGAISPCVLRPNQDGTWTLLPQLPHMG